MISRAKSFVIYHPLVGLLLVFLAALRTKSAAVERLEIMIAIAEKAFAFCAGLRAAFGTVEFFSSWFRMLPLSIASRVHRQVCSPPLNERGFHPPSDGYSLPTLINAAGLFCLFSPSFSGCYINPTYRSFPSLLVP